MKKYNKVKKRDKYILRAITVIKRFNEKNKLKKEKK